MVNAGAVAIGVAGVVIAMLGWIGMVMYAGRPAPRKPAVALAVVPAPVRSPAEQPSVTPVPLVRAYGDEISSGQRAA